MENFFSYGVVDLIVWAGIGDLVDTFRTETLKLSPITLTDGAALLDDHEVPFTYLWPASLVPKPADWGSHIDLANFIFYEQAQTYRAAAGPARLPGGRRGADLRRVRFVVVQDPVASQPHHLHRAGEGGRARHRVARLGAPRRRGASRRTST